MQNMLATIPANPDRAGALQFMALVAELCLRGIAISVAVAVVISVYLVLVGGLNG
jgi:hypothetical protein